LSTAGQFGSLGKALSDQPIRWVLHRPVELAGIIGMYGPPQSCKRKAKNGSWSAPMYSAFGGVIDSWP
jgi:hypothetical protein